MNPPAYILTQGTGGNGGGGGGLSTFNNAVDDLTLALLGVLTLITVAVAIGWGLQARRADKSVWKGLAMIVVIYMVAAAAVAGTLFIFGGNVGNEVLTLDTSTAAVTKV